MNEDQEIELMIKNCFDVIRGYSTQSKMTVCFNLTCRVLRLFCIRSEKEEVLSLIDQFKEGLKKEIEDFY